MCCSWQSCAIVHEKGTGTVCAQCGVTKLVNVLLRCGNCKNEYYCDVGCQRLHWKVHKTVCRGNPFDGVSMSKESKRLMKEAGMMNEVRRIVGAVQQPREAPPGKGWYRSIQVVRGDSDLKNFKFDGGKS